MAEKKGGGGWSSWFFGSSTPATPTPATPPASSGAPVKGKPASAPSAKNAQNGGTTAPASKPARPQAPGQGGAQGARKPPAAAAPAGLFNGLELAKDDDKKKAPAVNSPAEGSPAPEEHSSPSSFSFINSEKDSSQADDQATLSSRDSPASSPAAGAPAVRKRRAAKRPGTYYQENEQGTPTASPTKGSSDAPAQSAPRAEVKAQQTQTIPTKPSPAKSAEGEERKHMEAKVAEGGEEKANAANKLKEREQERERELREQKREEEDEEEAKKLQLEDERKRKEREEMKAAEKLRQTEIKAEEERKRKQIEEEQDKTHKCERVIASAKKELALLEAERQSLTDQQRSILSDQKDKHREMIALQEQLFRFEAEQTQALQQEDFERAERLNERIEEVKQAMKDIARHKLESGQELLTIHSKKGQIAHKEAYLRRNFIEKLTALKAEEETRLDSFMSQVSSKFSEEKERINAKKTGIQKHLNHVRMDLEMLLKSEETVQQSISSQTQSYKEELDKLSQKRETVQREIQELMKLLAQKKKEEEECTKQITGLEKSITRVTDRFKSEMERIAIEREAIAKDNHKYSQQMAELKKVKQRLKEEEAKDREAEKSFHTALATIEAELSHGQVAIDRLERREGEIRRMKENYEAYYRMETDQEKQLSSTREQTSLCSSTITELTTRVLAIQQEIHAANQRIIALDARIPSLDSEKKLAVSGRNFKEAKRIAEEMKTATVQIEESKAAVTSLTAQLEDCQISLSQQKERYKVLEQELRSAESRADKIKLTALQKKEKELLAKLTTYGDGEETDILALELESCKTEIAFIRLKWDLSEHAEHEDLVEEEPAPATETVSPAVSEETEQVEDEAKADELESLEIIDIAAAQEELRQLSTQIEHYEAELNDCIKDDDYDRADEINQLIENAKARANILKERLGPAASLEVSPVEPVVADDAENTEAKPIEEATHEGSAFSFVIASESDDEDDVPESEKESAKLEEEAPSSAFSFIQDAGSESNDHIEEETPATSDEMPRSTEDHVQEEPSSFAFISEPREEENETDSSAVVSAGVEDSGPVEDASSSPALASSSSDPDDSDVSTTPPAETNDTETETSSFSFIADDDDSAVIDHEEASSPSSSPQAEEEPSSTPPSSSFGTTSNVHLKEADPADLENAGGDTTAAADGEPATDVPPQEEGEARTDHQPSEEDPDGGPSAFSFISE